MTQGSGGRRGRQRRLARGLAIAGTVAGLAAVLASADLAAARDGHVTRVTTGATRGGARAVAAAPQLTVARLQYDGGGDWYANPSSLPNLLAAIAKRTTLPVAREEARVRLDDPRLWDYPFLHMTGHGNVAFSVDEVRRLREYLERGGFLHASDNYGLDESFRREIARVFPDRPLVEVPTSHAVYRIVYPFPKGLPKIHEHDGKPARGYGIFLGDRLAVFYDHECDLGNGWEDPSVHNDPPEKHEAALRMGVNLFVYAVTSRPTP